MYPRGTCLNFRGAETYKNSLRHVFSFAKGQYFLEAKMEFLDHEEEWFIDDKNIYVWAPKGIDPTNAKVSILCSILFWLYEIPYCPESTPSP